MTNGNEGKGMVHLQHPRSQALFPTPPPRRGEKKTLVAAGHVSPKIWEISNCRLEGGVTQ